jgi:diadenylate cyclase
MSGRPEHLPKPTRNGHGQALREFDPAERPSARLAELTTQVAPGTVLRHGLERMIRAQTGGLIVIGESPELRNIMSGGFSIDVLMTAQRLSELAKMDGAIVLDAKCSAILWANVHLMPDRNIPTDESGTRHRTAERVARQTGLGVVSVSKSMRVVTLYTAAERSTVPDTTTLHARADQAMQAVERYRTRFDEVVRLLDSLELSDQVTVRDVAAVLARGEMLHRLAVELDRHIIELGTEGRLLRLQAEELLAGLDHERLLLIRDYLADGPPPGPVPAPDGDADPLPPAEPVSPEQAVLDDLAGLTPGDLLDPVRLAQVLNLHPGPEDADLALRPRGHRLLDKVPRLGVSTANRLVETFGSLARILAAGPDELDDIEGIGPNQAKRLRDGLSRLADADPVKRYV